MNIEYHQGRDSEQSPVYNALHENNGDLSKKRWRSSERGVNNTENIAVGLCDLLDSQADTR